ncbi:MAG: AbrB/MazE/SpoVT family DNA-binding domain-containing protein [Nitrospirota bacterium]|nr:AbrB/MazE/SpoVT family DNA-binding domain-containing protein [Nitrospirota bacterium]
MSLVKIRERGQVTIPSEYRKGLGLEEKDVVNIVKVGETLILTRKHLAGDLLSRRIEANMNKKDLTLHDLLDNLKEQRKKYNKEACGKTKG